MEVVVGLFTLLGVVVGAVVDALRHKQDAAAARVIRLEESRLSNLDETRRYATALLDMAINIRAYGAERGNEVPTASQFPRAQIELIGDSDLIVAMTEVVTDFAAKPGVPISQDEAMRIGHIGGEIIASLRRQEERIIRGEALVIPSAADQDQRMRSMRFPARSGPPSPPV